MSHVFLPQNSEAEQSVLSSFLLAPAEVGAYCAERGVTTKYFHIQAHGLLYTVLVEMWTENKPIDVVTLTNELRSRGMLDGTGGPAFVTQLFSMLPTAANAAYYIKIIKEKMMLRSGYKLCESFSIRFQEEQDNVLGVINDMATEVAALAEARIQREVHIKPLVMDAAMRAQAAMEGRDETIGILTGIEAIDKETGSFQPTDFVLISGGEGIGKSMLASNVVQYCCGTQGKRAAIVSLEMPSSQITDRIICSEARINFTRLRNGWMNEIEMQRFGTEVTRIAAWPLTIHDADFNLVQIVAVFRQLKAQYPTEFQLGVIDYLQLIQGAENKAGNREQEVASISRTLRLLAKELEIVLICLLQLNEDGKTRESRQPSFDCTCHIRLENSVPEKDSDEDEKNRLEDIKIARIVKQRNGPSNISMQLFRRGEHLRFEAMKNNP